LKTPLVTRKIFPASTGGFRPNASLRRRDRISQPVCGAALRLRPFTFAQVDNGMELATIPARAPADACRARMRKRAAFDRDMRRQESHRPGDSQERAQEYWF